MILLLKLMKEIMKIMIQMMKKKEKTCIKSIILKFLCNPNDSNFDLFKFVGKINFCMSKLCKKKVTNEVINNIAEDFEKLVAVTKSKELKRYAKNILPNCKK